MSWVARKIASLDDVDQKQVIKEYFSTKADKLIQEKLLAEFWEEYKEQQDER